MKMTKDRRLQVAVSALVVLLSADIGLAFGFPYVVIQGDPSPPVTIYSNDPNANHVYVIDLFASSQPQGGGVLVGANIYEIHGDADGPNPGSWWSAEGGLYGEPSGNLNHFCNFLPESYPGTSWYKGGASDTSMQYRETNPLGPFSVE